MSGKVSPKVAQQLLQAMEQDLALATRLKSILQEEKSCLELRQYPAYQQVVKAKTDLLLQLDQADHQRKQLMESMGFNADRSGFMAFLQFVPASWKDKYLEIWESLSDTMNTCARLNKVNGKILAHSQNAIERLMVIILGQGSQPSIYQANGRRSMGGGQRILATA
jgi:flagella synthesis protein FlgN